MHSMATKSPQLAPWQAPGPLVGIAPVMSSRSTLRNDSACPNSCVWQYGVRRSGATGRAGREAAIDAIAVAAIGDDEDAFLGMCGAGGAQDGGK